MLPVLLSQNADVILPDYNEFTGFVFKLQANLDPRHRDRLAYIRVVSGRFEKGMKVKHILLQYISAGQPTSKTVSSNCCEPALCRGGGNAAQEPGPFHPVTPSHPSVSTCLRRRPQRSTIHEIFLVLPLRTGTPQPNEGQASDSGPRATAVCAGAGNCACESRTPLMC